MDGCIGIKWCNMDSDGQMERREQQRDGVCARRGSNKRGGGERGSEWESCQSPVQRAPRLKNVCNIPLLL